MAKIGTNASEIEKDKVGDKLKKKVENKLRRSRKNIEKKLRKY